ncbi:hypothetical protein INP57_17525 [Saccharopolyspora sp. HNM0986]|uniref:hypothetical protein n=1 Tax=Saccharopolyspora galaxeae TaxID=2781241 RepID=UPI00190AA1D0|nr:hypothetical protein [Saccharopolyspora sp. HNM0986]MBK0868618.1 hypothetical protein [Saccharopolyspora sp. HNM0986]
MTEPPREEPPQIAERVAAAVRAHPAVAELHGGPFGTIASHLPGRRVTGVRADSAGEPVEVGVVLRLIDPLPGIVAQLRELVAEVTGPAPVDITVVDVRTAEDVDADDPGTGEADR